MSGGAKLTLADQALANLMIGLASFPPPGDRVMDLALQELGELIPATSDHAQIRRLVPLAIELAAIGPRRGDRDYHAKWGFLRRNVSAAVGSFALWRAGLALDALRATMAEKGAA